VLSDQRSSSDIWVKLRFFCLFWFFWLDWQGDPLNKRIWNLDICAGRIQRGASQHLQGQGVTTEPNCQSYQCLWIWPIHLWRRSLGTCTGVFTSWKVRLIHDATQGWWVVTDYRYESRTCPLSCFVSINCWFVTRTLACTANLSRQGLCCLAYWTSTCANPCLQYWNTQPKLRIYSGASFLFAFTARMCMAKNTFKISNMREHLACPGM
jgi:hypothetical protein